MKKPKKGKKVKVVNENPDVRPKIRQLWKELSKDQRKAVIQAGRQIGLAFTNMAAEVSDTGSWKESLDPSEYLDEADPKAEEDYLPMPNSWLDKKSKGKETNCNQCFDTGGVMDVVVHALLTQVKFRTTP